MAISFVADRGSLATSTSGTTAAVDMPTGASITVGNYLIVRASLDNTGLSGAATTLAVTDPAGNTWTNLGPANQDPAGILAGVTCYVAYAKITNALANGDDLTLTYGNTTPDEAVVIEEWTGIHATVPIAVAAVTTNGASGTPSASITPTAAGQLVYGALGVEGSTSDTYTEDADTTDGSWSSLTRVGLNVSALNDTTVAGASKIVNGTSAQTWDPTITSRDWAQLIVVFAAAPTDAGGPDATRPRRLRPLLVR